jgi:L-rhamnose isomerase
LPARSNSDALPLTDDDVTQMKASDVVAAELITNYRIMLDFYGMVLVDARTGE